MIHDNTEAQITMHLSRAQFRALTKVAEEMISPLAYEAEAGGLLLLVALANIHIIKPHIDALRAYCAREGTTELAELNSAIAAQFFAKKGKRQP